jgi:serine/threonine protein kinase
MMNSQTEDVNLQGEPSSWVGLDVGDYLIEEQIGEGAFSWVYRGRNRKNGSQTVFKLAKPPEQVGKITSSSTMSFPTRALFQITGSFCEAQPDAAELLLKQCQKLQSTDHSSLVKVDNFIDNEVFCYYQCEYLEGRTLRAVISSREANLPILVELARALEELSTDAHFLYHGDLKPDNIVVTEYGIKLIDPGYFGEITHRGRPIGRAAVTTPDYYPLLEPDDLLAFGVIAWEALTGVHPLPPGSSSDQLDTTRVSPELLNMIQMREATGNYYGSGLLALRHPFENGDNVSISLGHVLLKLLRLRMSEEGVLLPDAGFRNFGDVADALAAMDISV